MKPQGYTLIELLVVLSVLGMLLGLALPRAGRWLDRAAAQAARDELAAGLARTRVAAVAHGGATLVLDPLTARIWIAMDSTRVRDVRDLGREYGVRVTVGTDEPVLFRYDALGIGRVTSRTVAFQRRGAEAGLTVSAYGRYRRW